MHSETKMSEPTKTFKQCLLCLHLVSWSKAAESKQAVSSHTRWSRRVWSPCGTVGGKTEAFASFFFGPDKMQHTACFLTGGTKTGSARFLMRHRCCIGRGSLSHLKVNPLRVWTTLEARKGKNPNKTWAILGLKPEKKPGVFWGGSKGVGRWGLPFIFFPPRSKRLRQYGTLARCKKTTALEQSTAYRALVFESYPVFRWSTHHPYMCMFYDAHKNHPFR